MENEKKLPLLVMTVGLSYSGKSTFLKQVHWEIVSPDALRIEMGVPTRKTLSGERAGFDKDKEQRMWFEVKRRILDLFTNGHEVVVMDATNTYQYYREDYVSDKYRLAYIDFSAVSAETCIVRAEANGDAGMVPVIRKQAASFDPLTQREKDNAVFVMPIKPQ